MSITKQGIQNSINILKRYARTQNLKLETENAHTEESFTDYDLAVVGYIVSVMKWDFTIAECWDITHELYVLTMEREEQLIRELLKERL